MMLYADHVSWQMCGAVPHENYSLGEGEMGIALRSPMLQRKSETSEANLVLAWSTASVCTAVDQRGIRSIEIRVQKMGTTV